MKPFKSIREDGDLALIGAFIESMDGELQEQKLVIDLPNYTSEDITEYLDSNDVEYTIDKNGTIWIADPIEEAEISILDEDVEDYISVGELSEGAARKKLVVRKGKKRILFVCGPGMMKRGPRQCVRRPASSLRKLKFRSKRSARKSKSKRGQSNRRRKISVRKRLSFGIKPRKKRRKR